LKELDLGHPSRHQLEDFRKFLAQDVANTERVAQARAFRLHQLPYAFPSARLEEGRSEAEELRARTEEGARERYRTIMPWGEPGQRGAGHRGGGRRSSPK
jgi:DNA polymerase III alpha subunit